MSPPSSVRRRTPPATARFLLVLALVWGAVPSLAAGSCGPATSPSFFPAASYILTNAAVKDAPQRYALYIRQMLDKLQNSAWPDDNNCAGGRSCTTCWVHGSQATNKQFNFVGNPTVDISTNSLVVSGTVDTSFDVPAYVQAGWRVPIFHWCWFDSTICSGTVGVTSTVDTVATFTFGLSAGPSGQTLVTVKPKVEVNIPTMNVHGCSIHNWLLRWLIDVQSVIKSAVNTAAQDAANKLSQQFTSPPILQPFSGVWVSYSVASLTFTPSTDVVMSLCASVTVSVMGAHDALVNVTYSPPATSPGFPPLTWPATPISPGANVRLNGLRVSTTLLDAMTFAADAQRDLDLVFNRTVLDATLDFNATFQAPTFAIPADGVGYTYISNGVLNVTCGTKGSAGLGKPILVFTFARVEGTANVTLVVKGNSIGLYPHIIAMNKTSFTFNLAAPKLPWSKAAERSIVEHLLGRLQSDVNDFNSKHPVFLPSELTPYLPNPRLTLVNQPPGPWGYMNIDSFCHCPAAAAAEPVLPVNWAPCQFSCSSPPSMAPVVHSDQVDLDGPVDVAASVFASLGEGSGGEHSLAMVRVSSDSGARYNVRSYAEYLAVGTCSDPLVLPVGRAAASSPWYPTSRIRASPAPVAASATTSLLSLAVVPKHGVKLGHSPPPIAVPSLSAHVPRAAAPARALSDFAAAAAGAPNSTGMQPLAPARLFVTLYANASCGVLPSTAAQVLQVSDSAGQCVSLNNVSAAHMIVEEPLWYRISVGQREAGSGHRWVVEAMCFPGCSSCAVGPVTVMEDECVPLSTSEGAGVSLGSMAVRATPNTCHTTAATNKAIPGPFEVDASHTAADEDLLLYLFTNASSCWTPGTATSAIINVGRPGQCVPTTTGDYATAVVINATLGMWDVRMGCNASDCRFCGLTTQLAEVNGTWGCGQFPLPPQAPPLAVTLVPQHAVTQCTQPPPVPVPNPRPYWLIGVAVAVVAIFGVGLCVWKKQRVGQARARCVASVATCCTSCKQRTASCCTLWRHHFARAGDALLGKCKAVWDRLATTAAMVFAAVSAFLGPADPREAKAIRWQCGSVLVATISAFGLWVWSSSNPFTGYATNILIDVGFQPNQVSTTKLHSLFAVLGDMGHKVAIAQVVAPIAVALLPFVVHVTPRTCSTVFTVVILLVSPTCDLGVWLAAGVWGKFAGCIQLQGASHGMFSSPALVGSVNTVLGDAFTGSTLAFISVQLLFIFSAIGPAVRAGVTAALAAKDTRAWSQCSVVIATMRYVSSMLLLAMALAVCLPLVIDYQGSQTNKWLLLGFVCQEVFFAVWFDYQMCTIAAKFAALGEGSHFKQRHRQLRLRAAKWSFIQGTFFVICAVVVLVMQNISSDLEVGYPTLLVVRTFMSCFIVVALGMKPVNNAAATYARLRQQSGFSQFFGSKRKVFQHDSGDQLNTPLLSPASGVDSGAGSDNEAAAASGDAALQSAGVNARHRASSAASSVENKGSEDGGSVDHSRVRRPSNALTAASSNYPQRRASSASSFSNASLDSMQTVLKPTRGEPCGARAGRVVQYACMQSGRILTEKYERRHRGEYGQRAPGRRLFLIIGTACTAYVVHELYEWVAGATAEERVQQYLHEFDSGVSWPKNGTVFNGALNQYHNSEWWQLGFFFAALAALVLAILAEVPWCWCARDAWYWGRWGRGAGHGRLRLQASQFCAMLVLPLLGCGFLVIALPDYIAESNISTLCPSCGKEFTKVVRQMAGRAIGLAFAALFTAKMLAMLLAAPPSILRGISVKLIDTIKSGDPLGQAPALRLLFSTALLLTPIVTGLPLIVLTQYFGTEQIVWLTVAFLVVPTLLCQFVWLTRTEWSTFGVYASAMLSYMGTLIGIIVLVAKQAGALHRLWSILRHDASIWVEGAADFCVGLVVLCDVVYARLEIPDSQHSHLGFRGSDPALLAASAGAAAYGTMNSSYYLPRPQEEDQHGRATAGGKAVRAALANRGDSSGHDTDSSVPGTPPQPLTPSRSGKRRRQRRRQQPVRQPLIHAEAGGSPGEASLE